MKPVMSATVCVLLVVLGMPALVSAKGPTTNITIIGPDLQQPVAISDPAVLKSFLVWAGAGVTVGGVEKTEGFIIDWAQGAVTDRPSALRTFELSFYVRFANRPLDEQTDQLAYVVSYAVDPATGQGYVYLPGKSEEHYSLNTRTIYRGREGNWFKASAAWQAAFRNVVSY